MLTASEIAEIRLRCERATPGPWHGAAPDEVDCGFSLCQSDGSSIAEFSPSGPWIPDAQAFADLDFVANSRTDLPAALDTIDEMGREAKVYQVRIIELERELDSMTNAYESAYEGMIEAHEKAGEKP